MGLRGKHQSKGNPGEGLDPQERQGTIVGEGRGGGVGCYRKLPTPERAQAHDLTGWGSSGSGYG